MNKAQPVTLRDLQRTLSAKSIESAVLLTKAAAGNGFDARRALKLAGQHVRLAELLELGPEDAGDE